MKFKPTKKWHSNQELAPLLFFAQRIDELYFDYSLDTYKPPALNCFSLCIEAVSLIEDIEEELLDRANLEHVLEELSWSLRNDLVAKKLLEGEVEKYISKDLKSDLGRLKTRLEVLARILSPIKYLTKCYEVIYQALVENKKKTIEAVIKGYSSMLIYNGLSKQYLYEQSKEFFFNGKEIESIDAIKDYFLITSPTEHNYEVYFIVSKLILQLSSSIEAFNVRVIDEPPSEAGVLAKTKNLLASKDQVWVEVKGIRACDRNIARKEAEEQLDVVRDLLLIFSHKNSLAWESKTIITQCCNDIPVIIDTPKSSMEKCIDLRLKPATKRLNNFIQNISLHGASFNKFHRAVDLHGIGISNELSENQLMSIWIAIETLVPSHLKTGGKIKNISNTIMPILLRNYFKRIIDAITKDLLRWNRRSLFRILRQINFDKGVSLLRKVLDLIALDQHSTLRQELYKKLGSFHLLRFRIFELNQLFYKSENIVERLIQHEKKVHWQFRRIYRVRNQIVHAGRSPSYIDTIIENAHDYLDQTFDEIVDKTCNLFTAATLEQVFDSANLEYSFFRRKLESLNEIDSESLRFLIEEQA